MTKIWHQKKIKLLSVGSSLLLVVIFLGHGCSQMASNLSSVNSSSEVMIGTSGGTTGSSIDIFPNASTVSLIYNKQLVDNLVSCTGLGLASTQTLAEWSKRQSSFSEYGYATDVTAPMLMAIAAVSGEICNDLVSTESVLPQEKRRIFNAINFSSGSATWVSQNVAETVRRITRSCWARNETSEELGIIQEEVATGLSGVSSSDLQQTKNIALMVCTGILSSLSGITF
ncbi:MAG: hypothetical protein K1X29_07310 [Bdellovibrionales bacterium]|nr:hypothetical protein [Bdellovibrionales bacterium]